MKGLRKDGRAIRVMAVDDSPVTRKMIKKALVPEGFEIVGEAGNGRDAVELSARRLILILLPWMLPCQSWMAWKRH